MIIEIFKKCPDCSGIGRKIYSAAYSDNNTRICVTCQGLKAIVKDEYVEEIQHAVDDGEIE